MYDVGDFGLFTDTRLGYDPGVGLSSVAVEPNPFSPNGDGLYDETRFTLFVSRETDWVTIEIYDVRGDLARTIFWQAPGIAYGRNVVDIRWDGKDDDGDIVPYGIYIARLEVRFKVAPNLERVNIAVVVIK
jgi:flagellar hook assembly protein FlgD